MYYYCIAYDDGNILIRYNKDGLIERYDVCKKEWIFDIDMAAIFTDKMPSRPISKKEADRIIYDRYENRWNKMDKYNYHICKELNNLVIRKGKNLPIQRYDPDGKVWLTDWDMLAVYTGNIIAIPISKEEARKIIGKGGKLWIGNI